MNQQTHRHIFIKNELVPTLYTCTECGCIQYKMKTTVKPYHFFSKYENDAFTSYFTSLNSQKIQWDSEDVKKASSYFSFRNEGINLIKAIATRFGLDERVYHSSIYLMDYLYIKLKYTKDIKRISMLCFTIVAKFYDNGHMGSFLETELFTKQNDAEYKMDEVEILKGINYDLFFVTAYDTLSFLLNNGIIFEDERRVSLDKIYFSCLLQLNMLVERNMFVQFTPFQISITIVSLARDISGLSPRNELFEELYGYDIDHYIACYNTLKSKIKIKQGRRSCAKKNFFEKNNLIQEESVQTNQIAE